MTRPLMTQADRSDVFRGLAHPLRRRVLHRLARGQATATQLLQSLRASPPSLAQHLAILREANLITPHRVGSRRVYRLSDRSLVRARQWLIDLTRTSP